MPSDHPDSSKRPSPGFALPAVLVIVAALLVLAIGLLLVVGTERSTARSFADFQRAELAARAGLEDFNGLFSSRAATDTYTVLQATLDEPIQQGRTKAPFLYLAQGKKGSGDAFTFTYTPLFSASAAPAESSALKAPEVLPLVTQEPNLRLEMSPLPWLDPVRVAWMPIHDEKGRLVARYAYWVEDLQSRLDPTLVGNKNTAKTAENSNVWPFPAPGLSPLAESATDQPLDLLSLATVDPASTADKPGPMAGTILRNKAMLISPEAGLAAAGAVPPLARDNYGHLANPTARAAEESLVVGLRPYDEQPRVPFATGIDPTVAGEPKLNLNALLAKGNTGVTEMAAFIEKALPEFQSRKGAFPEDYLKTLAANAIDYADADSKSTLTAGAFRGLDAFPLISEIVLQIEYKGMTTVNNRRILNWRFRLFGELWNPTSVDTSGKARLSYEVALPMEGVGAGTSSKRFDDPSILNDPNKATHNLERLEGKFWSKEKSFTLRANEYRVQDFADVTYKLDIGPSSITPASKFSLTEQEGAAGCSLMWNSQQVDRASGIVRQKTGLEFTTTATSKFAGKASVISLALGSYGSEIDNLGDPRITLYLRDTAQAENAYPDNISPNRRNIRRATIYDKDSARKPKTYGRTQPSEWPDGGHDSPVGTWTIATEDSMVPTDPSYLWSQNPLAAQAPQRISNFGRFYSATELGRAFDPLMWQPTYNNSADTNSIRNGLMPASQFNWPDVLLSSPPSTDHGGGNTLRVGRPEHPAFDRPGKRASHLLDLFHCGRPRSVKQEEREGNLARVQGHVNLNTAPRDVLRALAAGALGQDPLASHVPNNLNHSGAPLMAPPATPTTLYAASTSFATEADRIADAIIRSRPYASPSEIANIRDADGKPVFGNPDLYQTGGQIPAGTRVQWSDSAAEETFARVYEASTVRSRNFRVWVVGQALAPQPANSKAAPQVLAETRRVFNLFADPGTRRSDGSIDSKQVRPVITYERAF